MYPDLSDDHNNGDAVVQKNYQSVTTTTHSTGDREEKKPVNCCIRCAQTWIFIVGGLNLVLGILLFAFALYAKYGYKEYAQLSKTLPDGGIWMIFGFGIVLAICSIALILSAKDYDRSCCSKTVLFIFSLILMVVLLLEIIGAAVMAWALGAIALPASEVTDAIEDRIVQARDAAVNATWAECCIDNKPPYDIVNISKIDSACLWPDAATAVQKACGSGSNVQVCVCSSVSAYGQYLGLFVQSQLMWVVVATATLAVLVLLGLISTCVLLCAHDKSKNKGGKGQYNPDEEN